jgi:AcrR family transcriptional regulator
MPSGANAVGRERSRRDIPAEIIDAARKNFLHFGVSRTTMADIARDVGMSRQSLYEFVSSRDDLVDAVLVQRIKEIADGLTPKKAKSFAEAFIGTSVASIRAARNDRELMNIVATGPNDRLQEVVTGPDPEIHDIVGHLLESILDRGAQTGQLRNDKTRDEIIDWIRVVYLSLITQSTIDPAKEHDLIAGFLLPSLMFSAEGANR